MSKQIDERVVSMQFDNQHFEKNVHTTMGTLDKLKQSLNLTGASKGLENVSAAAGKVNMSGLASGVESVRMKFSALEVMGVTALANITNSAVNAGKRIVSALTIDPVKTGFSEYELKMDSIKTIMASTGEDLKDVNRYLEELNTYSDKTIYSFADMTQNIGKFTNAGVKLEDAVLAIQGISNEAAVSGANANEASRAMYNFAQALSSGYVKLIDWKSIELANMATVEFKEELIKTAVEVGTLTKASDGMYQTLEGNTLNATKNFNDTLQDQWMTTEVLIQTLGRYADETTDIGKKAFAAAQDVTKFSQVFDILKETAQSGWSKTWELIVGDLNQAKAWLTPFTNFLSGIVDGMSDFRNKILESALGKNFRSLMKPLENVKDVIDGIKEPIETVTRTLEDYNRVVNEVIRGKWGHVQKRWDALTEAGYDWITVQNMVNEKLGNSKRRQTDFVIGQSTVTKATEQSTEANAKYIATLTEKSEAELKELGLSDEQIDALKAIKIEADKLGLSVEDFINKIDEIDGRWVLFESFKNIWKSISQIFASMKGAWQEVFPPKSAEEIGAALYNALAAFHKFTLQLSLSDETADNLKRTFKGLFAIIDVLTTIFSGGFKIAFQVVSKILSYFNLDILEATALVGDALVAFNDWFQSMFSVDAIMDKLVSGFKTVVGWIKDWASSNETLNAALETMSAFLQPIVKHITNLFNALKGAKSFEEVIFILHEWILNVANAVGSWASGNDKLSKTFEKVMNYIRPTVSAIQAWIQGLKETDNIPKYIIDGLVIGLKNGIQKVVEVIVNLGKTLIETFCGVIDSHSPSKVFIAIGGFIIAGLIGGITGGAEKVFKAIGDLGRGMIEWFKSIDVQGFFTSIGDFFKGLFANIGEILGNIDWGSLIAIGTVAALLYILKKMADALTILAKPLDIIASITDHVNDALDEVGKYFKAKAFEARTEGIKNLAIAIAIMAGAIFLLASIEWYKLIAPVVAIGVLAGVMWFLAGAVEKMSKVDIELGKDGAKFNGINTALLGIAASMVLMAAAVAIMGTMDVEQMKQGFLGLAGLVIAIGVVLLAYGKLVKGKSAQNIDKAGGMLVKMGIAMGLMVYVAKLAGSLTEVEIKNGIGVMVATAALAFVMSLIGLIPSKGISKMGKTLIQMSIAMGLLVVVCKLAGHLKPEDIDNGIYVMTIFSVFVLALTGISKLVGSEIPQVGTTLMGISAAMLIFVGVCKLAGKLTLGEFAMGVAVMAVFAVFIGALTWITKTYGADVPRVAGTLIALAGAIGILAIVATMLGWLDIKKLAQGVIAIGFLSWFMSIMVKSLKGAQNVMKSLIVLTVAITLMAGAVALLSLIDPTRLAVATGALTLMMGMFIAMAAATKLAQGSMFGIIILTAVVAGLAMIIRQLSTLDTESVKGAAASLSAVLLSMSASLAILGVVGLMGPAVFTGLAALATLIVGLGVIIAALAGLNAWIPDLEKFLNGGIVILGQIGSALGTFVGNIVAGFAKATLSILPALGEALSGFMTNLQPFISIAKTIDGSVALGVVWLAAAIAALTVAELLSGLATLLGLSLVTLALELSSFIIALNPFLEGIKGIDAEAAAGANSLAGVILAITAANVLEGLTSWLTGGHSIEEFARQLIPFGEAMVEFSSIVAGNIDEAAVTAAANAGKIMAEMQSSLYGTGGVVQWFMGEKDMSVFGEQLRAFGSAIVDFSAIVSQDGAINEAAITAAANAGKIMTEMQSNLVATGGVVQWFMGEKDMSTFGEQLKAFGKAIVGFSSVVSKDGAINADAITAAANAGKMMAELQTNLVATGGVVQWFMGEQSLETFGDNLYEFGRGLKRYANQVKDIDAGAITASVTAAKGLVSLANTIPKSGGLIEVFSGGQDFDEFGDGLHDFGRGLKRYYNAVQGIKTSDLSSATLQFDKIINMAKTAQGVDFGSISKFGDALEKLGKTGVDKFAAAFTDATSKVNDAGKYMVDNAIKGAESRTVKMTTAFGTLASKSTTKLSSYYDEFSTAGKYLVMGFASGISTNTYRATAKAKAMAEAAYKAAQEALDVNSPSKVFRELGYSIPEGLAMGIDRLANMASDSSVAMADKAINSVRGTISRIAEAVNGDIDTQPTIRPVLDLSGVEAGAGAINGLFNNPSVGVMSNVRSINTMMNRQNGSNSDIVSAISDLKNTLNNRPAGNTYNVNGINYSEGEDVAQALETIIRAARVERRV